MRKELIISIVLIMIGVSLTFGCTGNKTTTPTDIPTATLTATPAATATPATTPMNVEVTIKDLAFDPANVSISVGDTVIWKNEDNVDHQIKIGDVESTLFSEGETFNHTFNTTGTFSYICTIHPSMKGTVIVK
ncbi:MAG TPA: plastocyanin/azurin family copper-binding protein [archaeon]|nr:plastocyanin/azurin family copper-binding protein [archaeon]